MLPNVLPRGRRGVHGRRGRACGREGGRRRVTAEPGAPRALSAPRRAPRAATAPARGGLPRAGRAREGTQRPRPGRWAPWGEDCRARRAHERTRRGHSRTRAAGAGRRGRGAVTLPAPRSLAKTNDAEEPRAGRAPPAARAGSCSLYGKSPASALGVVKGRAALGAGARTPRFAAPAGGTARPSVGGALAPPRGPRFREACSGRADPAPAPVETRSAPMEAPVEAAVENGDGDSSCGDLCCMDKGLRR